MPSTDHHEWIYGSDSESHWQAEIGGIEVHFGPGRMVEAARLVRNWGHQRALVVADPGVEAAGHLSSLLEAFAAAEIGVQLFTEIAENPTSAQVETAHAFAAPFDPDCIVAVGGGSTLDCGKGVNFLLTNGGSMSEYWGYGKAKRLLLPAIGIPTTAGTGSEAQSYALITDPDTHRKMACGDRSARFRCVILDPELLTTVPAKVAAAAGIDAIAHAVESFVSTASNPVSRILALRAWQLLVFHVIPMLSANGDVLHFGEVQVGAHLAGAAIEQSMLGAAHACANPLTGGFGLVHGQAIGLMLPHVVRFNAETVDSQYGHLAAAADLPMASSGGEALADHLEGLRRQLGLPERLGKLGITGADLSALAESAALEWTARYNPRPVGGNDL